MTDEERALELQHDTRLDALIRALAAVRAEERAACEEIAWAVAQSLGVAGGVGPVEIARRIAERKP